MLEQVRSGGSMMLCDFVRTASPPLVQIRLICPPKENLSEYPLQSRTLILAACMTYLYLAKNHLDNGDELVCDFSGEDGVETEEIMKHVNAFVAWAAAEWPTESLFVRSVVRGLDTARMCLVPDPHPEGFISDPQLFPGEGFGGAVVNLMVDPAPLGRPVEVVATPQGYFLQMNQIHCPEGAKFCMTEYTLDES